MLESDDQSDWIFRETHSVGLNDIFYNDDGAMPRFLLTFVSDKRYRLMHIYSLVGETVCVAKWKGNVWSNIHMIYIYIYNTRVIHNVSYILQEVNMRGDKSIFWGPFLYQKLAKPA